MKRQDMYYWIKKQLLGGIAERFAIYTQEDAINRAHQDAERLNNERLPLSPFTYIVEEAPEDVGL